MLLRTCIRVIPSVLRQTNNKPIFFSSNCNLLFNKSSYVLSSNSSNLLQSVRYISTKDNKSTKSTEGGQQIYYGVLTMQLRGVKIFSWITSLTGIGAQPFIYQQISQTGSVPLIVVACSFIGFFTLVTPVLLHLIAKKYITSIVYKPQTGTYVATYLNFFNIPQNLEFTPDDVKVPDVPGMFTSFLIKGKPLFVDPRLFEDPTHYGRIMGYDKPLDLKLFETSLNEKKT